jgi:hypothetical protein
MGSSSSDRRPGGYGIGYRLQEGEGNESGIDFKRWNNKNRYIIIYYLGFYLQFGGLRCMKIKRGDLKEEKEVSKRETILFCVANSLPGRHHEALEGSEFSGAQ